MAVTVNYLYLVLIINFLLSVPVALATDHVVGDSGGWTQSGDYSTWASGKTFAVGDNLVFNYGGSHGVDVVSKDDYDNCNGGNAIQSYSGGATTIPLTKPGPIYFICPTLGHCQTGMKLSVSVSGPTASSPAPVGSPSGGSESPPSSTTPTATTPPSSGRITPNAANGGWVSKSVVVVRVLLSLCMLG